MSKLNLTNNLRQKSSVFHTRDLESSDDVRGGGGGPAVNPTDFAEFLPWACAQLGVEAAIIIKKNIQAEPIPKKKLGKSKSQHKAAEPSQDLSIKSSSVEVDDDVEVVRIYATYRGDYLVHIKFEKTKHIPRQVLMVISLVVKLYPYLYGISIHSGMDQYTIYEMNKLIPLSNISEVDFDNSFCKEANYHILLENCKNIQVMSLARCKIGDEAAIKIAKKLMYLEPASQTLSVLNLSSNLLTDKSVKHFANVLRTNRKLCYLNLASNSITDEGAVALLKALDIFPLTMEETWQTKRQHMKYLKEKQVMISKIVDELRQTGRKSQTQGSDKKSREKRPTRVEPVVVAPKVKLCKLAQIMSVKPVDPAEVLQTSIYRERAEQIAIDRLGDFKDTFGRELYAEDGWLYCRGNNTLAYLNLAYNTVSYVTIKYLLKVLNYQKDCPRKPKGLVNVCLEGNPLPHCQELINIDFLLEVGLKGKPSHSIGHRRSSAKKLVM